MNTNGLAKHYDALRPPERLALSGKTGSCCQIAKG
jgi:hypothetical protein